MVRLNAFLALLAGFAVMLALVLVGTAVLRRWAPQWLGPEQRPAPAYVVVNLVQSFFAAAAGGFVTAWAAGGNALRDVLGLAIVILVLGAISTLQARAGGIDAHRKQPVWYQMMLLVISPLGAVAGGLLRLRVAGIL
jgi:hypothetical protein